VLSTSDDAPDGPTKFGHLVGAVQDYKVWFDHQVDRLADMIEL
jgi:hypothetical protein